MRLFFEHQNMFKLMLTWKNYIDQGEEEVNIGILRSTSHHVKCQQLFYYKVSQNKKATTPPITTNFLAMDFYAYVSHVFLVLPKTVS